ncbi:glycosyltransferase involved in cell wall biosynthesis [Rhodobium orientis]|uniref:Glycosyl transferase n=1 Tax=Rhodobium orientis TaxID=34017 RepID=A0A327JRD9_9HYPH|nr:glycosyltransferase family 4 protein [Rhodobium orientis]MBB4304799.1 glycosyltransferase involved in cell wall biosynthesis [Rhodobium orientis]MBK5948027.1 glycosyl transferase [Rhodobium orientis]RAI27462.1 glycosyl transferase [Rhodobium orientis]
MQDKEQLRIVHCIRAPVGGVFRHVSDLATAQAAAGHAVGLICDSTTGGSFEDARIAALGEHLSLGVTRIPMRRHVSPRDILSSWRVAREIGRMAPDVLHAHGAKGGAFARIIGAILRMTGHRMARFYCPHGGSLHYEARSLQGRVYFTAERLMEHVTDGLVFVSRFEADAYREKVGAPIVPQKVVHNGLRPEEFEPVVPVEDADDFLFIGTLRDLKGPDLFIRALARLRENGPTSPTGVIVGAGDDKPAYQRLVTELGLQAVVRFEDPMPAREAFRLARCVVIPSRAESLPYIVLEAIAAHRPLITTRVGGIPEIFGPESRLLVTPDDDRALAAHMAAFLKDGAGFQSAANARAERLRRPFSLAAMAGEIEAFYRETLATAKPAGRRAAGRPARSDDQVFIRQ